MLIQLTWRKKLKRNRTIKLCSPVILTYAAILSTPAYAESIDLNSVNEGLSSIQKAAESASTTTDALKTAESAGKAVAEQAGLTETLVNKLGITTEQAQGGAGAVFRTAKGSLDEEQFAALSKSVPEMDSLLKAAPQPSSSLSGLAGDVSAALGDEKNTYGNLTELASSFKELKISPEMADQFVPAIVDYVRTNGGALTADMLQSALY